MNLQAPFGVDLLGADLIPPCLTVALTDAQVLPTDGANCRVMIYSSSPSGMGSWSSEPNIINL